MMIRRLRHRSMRSSVGAMLLALLIIQGCSSDDDGNPIAGAGDSAGATDGADSELIRSSVVADVGGRFTTTDGDLTVIIPPGALSADTELVVSLVSSLNDPQGSLTSAGSSFDIDLGAELLNDMELQFNVEQSPAHPQIGESAVFADDAWSRSPSNFFRASDNTIVSLVSTDGVYQPVFRSLQAESGDLVERGRDLYLYETFGNESFFGDVIGLHTLLNNLAPVDAVAAGAQVDIARVPEPIANVLLGNDFAAKGNALQDPAVTRELLRAEAIVGITATFADESSNMLSSAGITCALCHTVVESTEFELQQGELTALPIGQLRFDGVPNTRMDVGAILSLTPFAQSAGDDVIGFLQGFGPGRFDARALPDNPLEDGVLNPTSIPPLWNFVDLAEQGYSLNWDGQFASTMDPDNALASRAELVYDLVMHANGAFGTGSSSVPAELAFSPSQARLDAFVAAEDNQPGNDIDQQALLDVQAWQRSIVSPPAGNYDETLAEEGFRLFNDKADCTRCHLSAEFTGPIVSADIVLEPPQGGLSAGIKTPGLRGLTNIAPYFHDDSAETLLDVLDVYSGRIVTELSESEKLAVVEYLKSL